METLKISSKSNPNSVAGAIAGLVKESNKAERKLINIWGHIKKYAPFVNLIVFYWKKCLFSIIYINVTGGE